MQLADIQAAAERISPLVHRTPVFTSRSFNAVAGVQCWFKCENFQRGGAFKIRGAANFLFSLSPQERNRGVVAFSSGNHAQAVAIAARHFGVKATIVMPSDAPASKLAATKEYGADVILYDRLTENREAIGRRIAEETGAALVPPFDHPWIIAGQGTAALELLEEVPELDAIIACVGGGGLLSGSSVAAKGAKPTLRVYGAEPAAASDTYQSLRAGKRVRIAPPDTIADGLRAPEPGELTFPIIQRLVDGLFLVSEDEIRNTAAFLQSRMKIVVEPSGAVSAAAVLGRKLLDPVQRVGIILSGGNI